MKPRYKFNIVLQEVAATISPNDLSSTTIRCAINDRLDNLHKDGYAVHHDYAQKRAIRIVRNLVRG